MSLLCESPLCASWSVTTRRHACFCNWFAPIRALYIGGLGGGMILHSSAFIRFIMANAAIRVIELLEITHGQNVFRFSRLTTLAYLQG